MTTLRYRATSCASCGNHTVMFASGICETCVSQPYPASSRRLELALIYAAGVAAIVAFLLVVMTGHVRAQTAVEPGRVTCKPFLEHPTYGWSCSNGTTAWTSDRDQSDKKPTAGCVNSLPDGNGGCLKQSGIGSIENCVGGPGCKPLQLDSSGKVLCRDDDCRNNGLSSSGSLRVQILPDDLSALVIRTRDKKSVMVRGLNMGACTATAAEISKSPDVEFAECFR